MPNLLKECKQCFDSKNLYDVLGVDKTATEEEIKRAYRKASLHCHPDRVSSEEKENATKKFQVLGKVYSILSDKEKKAVYDESGEIDEETVAEDRDWLSYWRLLFKKITVEDIKNFEKTYKGSAEETEDLKSAYLQYKGDVERIMDSVLCCNMDDEPRFRDIIAGLVERKELPKHAKFFNETAAKKASRKKKAEKEAEEAAEARAELGLDGGEASLQQMILARQASRQQQADNFFQHLADKYGGSSGGSKGSKAGSSSSKKAAGSRKRQELHDDSDDDSEEKKGKKKASSNGRKAKKAPKKESDASTTNGGSKSKASSKGKKSK